MKTQKTLDDFHMNLEEIIDAFNLAWQAIDMPQDQKTVAGKVSTHEGERIGLFRKGLLVHIIPGEQDNPGLRLA